MDIQNALAPFGIRGPRSHYKTPPYVTASPEVTSWTLEKDDAFIVMATDGLWDELSNEQAVQVVGNSINTKSNASTELIRHALSHGDPNRLNHILAIPSPLSRRYRDDITTSVVYFGKDETSHSDTNFFSIVNLDLAQPKKQYLSTWLDLLKGLKPKSKL